MERKELLNMVSMWMEVPSRVPLKILFLQANGT